MRRQTLDFICASCRHCSQSQRQLVSRTSRRHVQISATPTSTEPASLNNSVGETEKTPADARFEVLGSSFSLLSASISASQHLYTRKGTLVGFNGNPEDAISTLSLLSPLQRLPLGIPFLYQRLTSPTPYTALLSPKSPHTNLSILHLDGRKDWLLTSRSTLLAWTGHNLSLSPRTNLKLGIAHWGNTLVSGRGLLALAGKGAVYQIHLKTGEEYLVHPANVIAYAVMASPPQPYRFRATTFRLQIPNPLSWIPDTRFWRTMRESAVWRFVAQGAFVLRTWARRTVWGDRLFLHFQGPTTLLLQSRGASLTDVLTSRDVNELADAPAGSVQKALSSSPAEAGVSTMQVGAKASQPTQMSFASVSRGGGVKFEKGEEAR